MEIGVLGLALMNARESQSELLQKRLTAFGSRLLRVAARLPQNYQAQHVAKQCAKRTHIAAQRSLFQVAGLRLNLRQPL